MRICDLEKVNHFPVGILALGFFDCIHMGHVRVIDEAKALSRRCGTGNGVFLFKNNIFPLLGIEKTPVFTFEERVSFVESLGVDSLIYIDANREFLSKTPQMFIDYLREKLEIDGFVCGKDFTFGAGGKGGPRDLSAAFGDRYAIVELFEHDGRKISSESVKNALNVGDIPQVNRLLGRTFSLMREVECGRSDGRKMGYPTINAELGSVPLKDGVYFTTVIAEGRRYSSLTSVGPHPTLGDYHRNIETYLLDYQGDLYGKKVTVEFASFHRDIVKFDTPQALIAQIDRDVAARRKYDQIRSVGNR